MAACTRGARWGVAVVAILVPCEAMASPWALRRLQQPETSPVVPPAPELERADEEPGTALPPTQLPPTPPPMATSANGPGSTDVLGYRPRPVRPPRYDPEPTTGMGLVTGGVIMAVLGAVLVGNGAGIIASRSSAAESDSLEEGVSNGISRFGGAVLIGLGIGPLIGGLVMTGIGASQASEHRTWQKRQLTASAGRTRHGSWTVGMQLAF